MLPTYWFPGPPPIYKQRNPHTSQKWVAISAGETPQGTFGIATQQITNRELLDRAEFAVTAVALLDSLVSDLVEEGAVLTEELRAELPRRNEPVPPSLARPGWTAIDIVGHVTLAQEVNFGEQRAFITVFESHWVCAVLPAEYALRLEVVSVPLDVSWERTATS